VKCQQKNDAITLMRDYCHEFMPRELCFSYFLGQSNVTYVRYGADSPALLLLAQLRVLKGICSDISV